MSITGSLLGYDNNNEIILNSPTNKRNHSLLNMSNSTKPCQSLNSSIANSVITTASSNCSSGVHLKNHKAANPQESENIANRRNRRQHRFHLNTLWSIWYGLLITIFQGYLIVQGAHRYLGLSLTTWKFELPESELNIQIISCGIVIILLPLFLGTAIFKVGNFANDGVKLATGKGRCSLEPQDGLEEESQGGTLRALWTHGGPTSSFIHLVTALLLLLPRLLLEAKLIENGLLPKDTIWRTELDFIVHEDRLVTLSFMTSPYQNVSSLISTSDPSNAGGTKYYPIFEKTELIEKIRPDYDDDYTHENLESIDYPYSSSSISISTNLNTHEPPATKVPTTGTLTTTKRSTVKYTKPVKITVPAGGSIGSTMAPMQSTVTTASPSTTVSSSLSTSISTTMASIAKSTYSNQMAGSVRKNDTKLKNSSHNRKHSSKQHKDKHHHHSHQHHQRNKDREMRYDDVDAKLELRSETEIDFDDVSTVIEVTKNNKKQHIKIPKNSNDNAKDILPIVLKKSVKDSDIHIVKPEKIQDGIIPSTPVTTNSKIIEIKPNQSNRSSSFATGSTVTTLTTLTARRIKRFTETTEEALPFYDNSQSIDEDDVIVRDEVTGSEIRSEQLIGIPENITLQKEVLTGFSGFLQNILGVEQKFDPSKLSLLPSLEFINFVIAIIVWSARYPSVFWGTSKSFALIFSMQLICNSIDILLCYAGTSVLYKLQIIGIPAQIRTPLILNANVTLSLTIFAIILILSSSMVLYLYGHGRLSAKMRDRRLITVSKAGDAFTYFAHCASLCFVLALAVVKAPIMHDLSAIYRSTLDGAVLVAALSSIIHIFIWLIMWFTLTAKRRWSFKLPPLEIMSGVGGRSSQPLLVSPQIGGQASTNSMRTMGNLNAQDSTEEETIYWPKITPNSPKLKVTFNEVPSTSSDHNIEHNGKRNKISGAKIRMSSITGEIDDGDYATLRGPTAADTATMVHMGGLGMNDHADDTSEEGKLLACVIDDSVTYASTRDLEPPINRTLSPENFIVSPHSESLTSPLTPVTVTVHTNEAHIMTSAPRCLRRGDSGMPNEALTPRSDTTSTESSTSPPDRAPSETSSGVHSGEERDEVVIRPRAGPYKSIIKPPQPVIQEEPFSRSTNMKMSSFVTDNGGSSATLPLVRNTFEPKNEYPHCSTMPLPVGCHQAQNFRPQSFTASTSKTQLHTTLPNGVRYSTSNQYLRRLPHMKNAESPYGHLGFGSGHHTFSKLLHDPLGLPPPPSAALQMQQQQHMNTYCTISSTIPEDRDSANYSMISDHDRDIYINNTMNQIQLHQ